MAIDPAQQDVYRFNPRNDVAPFLPVGVERALDVGCSVGGLGVTLRDRYGPDCRVVGVEAVLSQAEQARASGAFDEVVDGYFPDVLAGRDEQFDLISFIDVIEHVVDPWALLDASKQFLAPGGHVVAAIPSIRYAPVVWQLIRGRWDYRDEGTLDRTHLRFFTRATALELFEEQGFEVRRCEMLNSIRGKWATDPLLPRRWAKFGVARALGDAAFLHVLVVARVRDDATGDRPDQ